MGFGVRASARHGALDSRWAEHFEGSTTSRAGAAAANYGWRNRRARTKRHVVVAGVFPLTDPIFDYGAPGQSVTGGSCIAAQAGPSFVPDIPRDFVAGRVWSSRSR